MYLVMFGDIKKENCLYEYYRCLCVNCHQELCCSNSVVVRTDQHPMVGDYMLSVVEDNLMQFDFPHKPL